MHGTLKSAAVIALSITLSSCDMGMNHMNSRYTGSTTFASNGERIYFTGVGHDGRPIVTSGGHAHQSMHSQGCVACHGTDREGGARMYPFFWIQSPPLTTHALFGEHNDGHGDHDSYSRATLRRAIQDGIDPSGDALDNIMPRWAIDEQDLNDLVDYLAATTGDSH